MASSSKKKLFGWDRTIVIWAGAVFAIALLLGGGAAFGAIGYGRLYEGRIFPGVRVLGVRLDGLTAQESREALHKAVDTALKDGLRFRISLPDGGVRDVTLAPSTVATQGPDGSRDLLRYDLEPAIAAATAYGRSNNLLFDTLARWRSRIHPVQMDAGLLLDEEGITEALTIAADEHLPPVRDAELDVRWDATAGRANVTVKPEQYGRRLETEVAIRALRRQAERLRFEPIPLQHQEATPLITSAQVEPLKSSASAMLNRAPFRFQYEEHNLLVTTSTFAGWLGVELQNNKPILAVLPDRFADGIRKLAPGLEKTAKQGSLVFENGKISRFEPGTEGLAIDDVATRQGMLNAWNRGETPRTFPLVVNRTEPALAGQDPERLGIREIIGEGHSNFSGSPSNRRKNIALGVAKVNGTLIPPGGEFSLLTTLGPVTAENGWLPELVIKGNKTEPELGGGLCQIGTTAFRAALGSGLPITERRNHSYRVRYYEPAGTDATIYEPKPDFRFKNDTQHHVLIHAYIEGDDITYEYWGTDDDRKTVFKGQTEVTDVDDLKPRVFNVTAPPETKLVETLDLKPGEKKCTEVAHAGADAEFTYHVTYADGSVKSEVFRSHYRPWQAVCLIGVEKLSDPTAVDASVGGSPDSVSPDAINE